MPTPLVLVALWLVLDRTFVRQLWMEESLAGALQQQPEQWPR